MLKGTFVWPHYVQYINPIFKIKDNVKSVQRIGSAHKKRNPTDKNFAQIFNLSIETLISIHLYEHSKLEEY